MRFPNSVRLKKSRDFQRVREKGKSAQTRLLRLGVLRLDAAETPLVGIVTSRRLGGAVVRNKIRRRLREIARAHLSRLVPGLLLVIIAKPPAATAPFGELKAEWLLLARRLSILADSE